MPSEEIPLLKDRTSPEIPWRDSVPRHVLPSLRRVNRRLAFIIREMPDRAVWNDPDAVQVESGRAYAVNFPFANGEDRTINPSPMLGSHAE